ncbi:MAG: hypothetical protein DHS20C02_03660 [Micavibrio sp.]|nr:MAG: hypothetical protein DHS20C02_03660 [Micavibrio sp.]
MLKSIKIAALGLVGAVFLWLAGYMAFSVSSLAAKAQHPDETTDAIIVPTGGNKRVKTGLELFAQGRASHLFISGVNPKTTKWEIMKLWDGEPALPPCCLTLGHEAETTRENAQEAREWVQEHEYTSVRLVTSGYHMSRALLEFRHALPDVEIIKHPVPYKDYGPTEKKFWAITFSEYNKRLYRGFLLTFTPKKKLETKDKE